jgi:hypothetical protein
MFCLQTNHDFTQIGFDLVTSFLVLVEQGRRLGDDTFGEVAVHLGSAVLDVLELHPLSEVAQVRLDLKHLTATYLLVFTLRQLAVGEVQIERGSVDIVAGQLVEALDFAEGYYLFFFFLLQPRIYLFFLLCCFYVRYVLQLCLAV